uniref:Cytochrome P450 2A1 n=1 Tax=Magallana gigas TaxID=29159 RepID=K1QEW0_MAGGI
MLTLNLLNVQTVLVALTVGLLVYFIRRRFIYRLPPGPWAIPLIGNFEVYTKPLLHRVVLQLSKKYGPVTLFSFGPIRTVFLNNYEVVMEAMVKRKADFAGRPASVTCQYNAVLDAVVSKFMQKMSQLQHSRKRALLDGFAQAFQTTVEQLKQTFGGVADVLHGSGSGLLGQLTQHLSGASGTLATQLSGLKETASQLLASGQEALAGVHQTGAAAVDQLHTGLTGAGSQLIDQLLHPAGTK